MIFWIIAGVLSAGAVAGLLAPLLRQPRTGIDRGAYDLTVYRDQLAEIDRDLARGDIGAEQAAAARTEIERRLLAIDSLPGKTPPPTRARFASAVVAIAVPAAALGVYLFLGVPHLPSQPFAEREAAAVAPTQGDPAMDELAGRLAARLEANPNDRDGWMLLGRTYTGLQRFDEAARAYGQAIENGFDEAEMHAARGESLTAAAGGAVEPEARRAFAAALERDPDQPRARYYAGLALAQDGRVREAIDLWTTLLRGTPASAPWRRFVAAQVRRAAAALGEEPPPEAAQESAPAQAGTGGPAQADIEAAGEMSEAERTAFIRSMVERLANRMAAEPENLEGWLRLAQAYGVLGEASRAQEAMARADALIRDLPADAPERAAVEAARAALPASD